MKHLYVFLDIDTKEEKLVICEQWEVHTIEKTDRELGEWCEGRTLFRFEQDLDLAVIDI